MNSGVIAQKIDTICVETEIYRSVVASSKQVPILKERISILNDRIATKDSAIARLESASFKDEGAIMELQGQKGDLQDEVKILKTAIDDLTKQIRKEKWKRTRNTVIGVVGTAAAVYLSTKK